MSHFFAFISRLKYIDRWALMRNSTRENLSEHSLEVAMLAHALCIIGNKRFAKKLNADRAAVIGMYHDTTEIITGDMPTPIKYFNSDIIEAFKQIEANAAFRLVRMLPGDLQSEYREIYEPAADMDYEKKLVKAADKLSALIKCKEERKAGNGEFKTAEKATEKYLREMKLPEVEVFMEEFLPSYDKTLDELA